MHLGRAQVWHGGTNGRLAGSFSPHARLTVLTVFHVRGPGLGRLNGPNSQ